MSTKTILASCNPNRHGEVRLLRYEEPASGEGDDAYDGETLFVVVQPGESDTDGSEYLNEADARAFYDQVVKHLSETPNWEAQAEYDAQWGTDNGYGLHQSQREY